MQTKEEEIRYLAGCHYDIESGMNQVFRIFGPEDVERNPNEPIKLLEVNENTVPAGIMPIGFGPLPSSGLYYSSIIVEVTPDEFEKIRSEEWSLPHGWKIGELIPRSQTVEST